MGKKIQTGNAEGILLTDNDIELKNKVIDYLYEKINLSSLRYVILDNIQKLKFLQENEHYVSPNYKGINYLLIFMTIMGKSYTFLINRKKLSYHKNQLDMKNIFIVKIVLNTINNNIFSGSIFDGKIILKEDKYHFLINDCFYVMGKNILNMDMETKILYLNDIINSNLVSMNACDNFDFKLNKIYKYNDIPNLISNIIPNNKINNNGLIFYPKKSGISIIHVEKKLAKIDIENKTEKIDIVSSDLILNFVKILENRTYSYETSDKTKILYISKTNIPDVYNLYENNDNKKIGIAHIPNIKISHYCSKNITTKPVKCKCIFNQKFNKWIPIEIIN